MFLKSLTENYKVDAAAAFQGIQFGQTANQIPNPGQVIQLGIGQHRRGRPVAFQNSPGPLGKGGPGTIIGRRGQGRGQAGDEPGQLPGGAAFRLHKLGFGLRHFRLLGPPGRIPRPVSGKAAQLILPLGQAPDNAGPLGKAVPLAGVEILRQAAGKAQGAGSQPGGHLLPGQFPPVALSDTLRQGEQPGQSPAGRRLGQGHRIRPGHRQAGQGQFLRD